MSPVWPFTDECIVKDRSDEELAEGRGRWWKTGASSSDVGQRYSYSGVLQGLFAEHIVGKQNRILVFGEGEEFRIEDATHYPLLGYVEVGLVRVAANG